MSELRATVNYLTIPSSVLVTGAASGIGAGVADWLEEAGARVIRADVTSDRSTVSLDVTDEAGWATTFERNGPVDALVNCAGIRTRAPITEMALADFRQVVDVNLVGSFLGIRELFRHLVARSARGVVVNTSSINAFGAVPNQAHYASSKAGVNALTMAAAVEGAPLGIRVNSVAPGPIETPLIMQRFQNEDQRQQYSQRLLMKRMGATREVAEAVGFLLSEQASYITGTNLPVDGGYLAYSSVGDTSRDVDKGKGEVSL